MTPKRGKLKACPFDGPFKATISKTDGCGDWWIVSDKNGSSIFLTSKSLSEIHFVEEALNREWNRRPKVRGKGEK